jgi:hypothetical protein
MNQAQPPVHVLLLTPQEHDEVFTSLRETIDETKAGRLAQVLRLAEARGKDFAAKRRSQRIRSSVQTIVLWAILIALFVVFYNIFSRA